MTAKNVILSVFQLQVFQENPRFQAQSSQDDAIYKIISDKKIFKLMNDIAMNGLDPSESFMVFKAKQRNNYIVKEGNRRMTSVKLLNNPELIPEKVPDRNRIIKKIQNIISETLYQPIEKVRCVVFEEDDELLNHFIELKHTGENNGAGRVTWNTTSQTRFQKQKKPFNDYLLRYIGNIHPGFKDNTGFTTIERIIGDPDVRKAIGMLLDKKKPEIILTDEIAKMKLFYIIDGIVTKDLKVGDVYNKALRKHFISMHLENDEQLSIIKKIYQKRSLLLDEGEIENLEIDSDYHNSDKQLELEMNTSEQTHTLQEINIPSNQEHNSENRSDYANSSQQGNETHSNGTPRNETGDISSNNNPQWINTSSPNNSPFNIIQPNRNVTDIYTRKKLFSVYKLNRQYNENARIKKTIYEMQNTEIKDMPISLSYLIRSLLENYTHEYIDIHINADGALRIKGVAREREKRKELRELLLSIKEHLGACYEVPSDIIALIDEVCDKSDHKNPLTAKLNIFIHSNISIPSARQVIDLWLKAGPIIQYLDLALAKNLNSKVN